MTSGFLLHVSDAGRHILVVDGGALALPVLELVLELLALVLEPLRDLLAAERELASTVFEVEQGKRVC